MRKLIVLLALLMLVGLPARLTWADNGPHGGYTATTAACAGCHRAHTAPTARLLLADSPALCLTCHGASGSGATTNVADGLDTNSNRSLRGGGFTNVAMNPAEGLAGSTVQVLPVTSNHSVNGGLNTVWGYGAISAVPNPGAAGVTLTCTSCHNPHGRAGTGGTATYRLLKGNSAGNTPLFGTQGASVDLPDEVAKTYSTSTHGDYFGDHGSTVGGGSINAQMTNWCAQCHTRYHAPSPATPGSTDSGDAVFKFRHVANDTTNTGCTSCHPFMGMTIGYYPGCAICHVAHGTGVRMSSNSGSAIWPDGSTTPSGDNRSALLRIDNRGVCWQCHVDRDPSGNPGGRVGP